MKSHFLIGAANSGSGKTTLTAGIIRSIKRRGYSVQPFKCGPDYIDIKYHALAAGLPSVNMDLFFMDQENLKNLYEKYRTEADVSIFEGVMGLFDGYEKAKGSSAEIAKALSIPVISVVNAKSLAYSAAPLLYGLGNFDSNLKLYGVIFNMVSSEKHYLRLKEAAEDAGVKPLGYFPFDNNITVASRHLGLKFEEDTLFEEYVNNLANMADKHIDIEELLRITQYEENEKESKEKPYCITKETADNKEKIKIAIASDNAFNFTYVENIRELEKIGEVIYFSPLNDKTLPSCNLLYLPGGYPELYCRELSENKTMIESIKTFTERAGAVIAECGGMMYLCQSIADETGKEFPMVSALPLKSSIKGGKLKIGYRTVISKDSQIKGHEFHYSTTEGSCGQISDYQVFNAEKKPCDTIIYKHNNILAGYIHFYWGEEGKLRDLLKIADINL